MAPGTQPTPFDRFEAKLIELFAGENHREFVHGPTRIGLEQKGSAGEITLALLSQDMRDFCRVDSLDDEALEKFTSCLALALGESGASRMRIGPLSADTCRRLAGLLGGKAPEYLFHDAVLSIEPLLIRSDMPEPRLSSSLRRALRGASRDGLRVSARSYSPEEMEEVHTPRWGANRSRAFFEAMEAFSREPYCDCLSVVDAGGRILGQQIDYCLSGQRYYYYSAARHAEYPGVGKVLLGESISRFLADPAIRVYSFGRGGEPYKYRYANGVRRNHYLVGYNNNGKRVIE